MQQLELIQEIKEVLNRGQSEFQWIQENLTLNQWFQLPTEGWSAFQVLEHINIALSLYLPRLEQKLTQMKISAHEERLFRRGIWGHIMVHLIKPKKSGEFKPTKTLKVFYPVSQMEEEVLKSELSQLAEYLNRFDVLISQLSDKDLNSLKVNSAIGPVMRFNYGAAVEFLAWHHIRHFHQLRRVAGC